MRDIHQLPVRFTNHAVRMLAGRLGLSLDEARHHIKVARVVKPVEKDGACGILQSDIGRFKVRFVYLVREGILWIVTVEVNE